LSIRHKLVTFWLTAAQKLVEKCFAPTIASDRVWIKTTRRIFGHGCFGTNLDGCVFVLRGEKNRVEVNRIFYGVSGSIFFMNKRLGKKKNTYPDKPFPWI
jgi:hypothetical protein